MSVNQPYPGADNPRRWDDVQAERDQHLRECIGPELDDWLEDVTDEATQEGD